MNVTGADRVWMAFAFYVASKSEELDSSFSSYLQNRRRDACWRELKTIVQEGNFDKTVRHVADLLGDDFAVTRRELLEYLAGFAAENSGGKNFKSAIMSFRILSRIDGALGLWFALTCIEQLHAPLCGDAMLNATRDTLAPGELISPRRTATTLRSLLVLVCSRAETLKRLFLRSRSSASSWYDEYLKFGDLADTPWASELRSVGYYGIQPEIKELPQTYVVAMWVLAENLFRPQTSLWNAGLPKNGGTLLDQRKRTEETMANHFGFILRGFADVADYVWKSWTVDESEASERSITALREAVLSPKDGADRALDLLQLFPPCQTDATTAF